MFPKNFFTSAKVYASFNRNLINPLTKKLSTLQRPSMSNNIFTRNSFNRPFGLHHSQTRFYGNNYGDRVSRYIKNTRYPLYITLMGINLGVWGLWSFPVISQNFMASNFVLSGDNLSRGRIWNLLTYSFSHYNILHLASNMFGLYFFGSSIERIFGPKLLLQLYIVGALTGAFFQIARNNQTYGGSHLQCLGASASLSAVLSFFVMMYPNETILLFFIPMPAWVFGVGFFTYSLFNYRSSGNTGHAAHFGGIIGGLGMYYRMKGGFR
jgi:membrane associated rhomboid family serine protease